jgi:prepilin signal peptidase PulO-like enzyme (type II secretory pathway)
VQLQHHARHHLPTYRLIFLHVVESLVFVPIMIGILFFLFEFFDDQLLAFMVLTLVWLCELFTMISVRTSLSMQYFPRFFFLYFMVFHIYFFSYTYGFSYLALLTTAAFMQHLILYFWNHFEIPALQTFLRERALLQHQQLHITSSAILTSTVHMTQATNLSGTARALARTDDQSSGIYDAQMGIGFLDTQTPSGPRGLNNLSNSSIESSSPLVPGVTMESPDLHTSRAQFDPRISNWFNNVIHETGSSDRSTEMDAVDARSQREREHDRGRGTASRFRLTGSEEVTSPSAVLHSSFMAFGSVVPWMLASPSLFLSLFRETGNPITRVESSFNPELGNPGSTSSTTQQGIISTSEERLRQQTTGNRSGESQNC